MTLSALLTFFVALFVAAAIPGPGVLVVVARSLSQGFKSGAFTALGVICGDFILIIITVLGLSSLSAVLGNFFDVIKYLGGAYLVYLGFNLIRSGLKPQQQKLASVDLENHFASFIAGFITTISNPKAIFFYASLFPNLVSIANLTLVDFILVEVVAICAVGSVMLGYAFISSQSKNILAVSRSSKYLKMAVGGLFIGSGIFIAVRS